MAILNITAVLYALGWALLHSLWQMGALWLVYQLFLGIPKKWSPAVKHNGSLILLIFGFVWFLATGLSHFREYVLVKQFVNLLPQTSSPVLNASTIQQAGSTLFILSENLKNFSVSTFNFLELYIGYIAAIYLFILVLMMFRFTNAYLYANQLKKKGIFPAGAYLNDRIVEWSIAIGIHHRVNLLLSQSIDIPATIGFLKPVILLPVATVNQLSMDQVESIILHELAHIKRMDYLWNITAAVIETILFFNPFVYLLTNVQKKERELCCDDFVLGFNRDPHNYATALLELEKTRMSGRTMLAMASNGQDGQLISRVKRILNVQTNQLQYRQRFIALLFITTLMSALAWLQPVQWKNDKPLSITTALPAKKWMPENTPPMHAISDRVKKQAIFEKIKMAPAKKMTVNIEKKLTVPTIPPPPPPVHESSQFEINLLDVELANTELFKELSLERKRGPVYINQAPRVKLEDQKGREQNYTIRIETDDETIEINIVSDSLKRKIIKTTEEAAIAPIRRSTIRSVDTYPRNRY